MLVVVLKHITTSVVYYMRREKMWIVMFPNGRAAHFTHPGTSPRSKPTVFKDKETAEFMAMELNGKFHDMSRFAKDVTEEEYNQICKDSNPWGIVC
jgi:hypothetical protein